MLGELSARWQSGRLKATDRTLHLWGTRRRSARHKMVASFVTAFKGEAYPANVPIPLQYPYSFAVFHGRSRGKREALSAVEGGNLFRR